MDLFQSEAFSSRVRDLMDEHHTPGLAIAVVKNNKTASKAFGYACLDPPEPATPDTLFDIASCSKSMTAAAVGLLVEDNDKYPEVQYDAIMSSLLPEDFVMPSAEYTDGVTVDDVLSHKTGMPRHDMSYLGPKADQPDDARSITRNLRNLPVAAPLRAKYMYNNMMYSAASHLVEVKTQQSFSDFLEERFFGPLHMRSTSLQPSRAREKGLGDRIAKGYCYNKEKSAYTGFDNPECPEGQGAGSIITSANDFILWVKALMRHEGPISGEVYQGLVRQRTITNPTGRRLKPLTSPVVYAAGLEVYYYRGHMVVGHDGAISGFQSHFFFLPRAKFGAFVAGNSSDAGTVAGILGRQLIDAALGVGPEVERPPRNVAKNARNDESDIALRPKSASQDQSETPSEENSGRKQNSPEKDEAKGQVVPDNKSKPKSKKAKAKAKKAKEQVPPPPPQDIPLSAYVGRYWNAGYHNMIVEIRDEKLFIDATDRSFQSTLTFDHVSDQTKYTATVRDIYDDYSYEIRAEFVLEDGRAARMGLEWDDMYKHLIWFEYQQAA
ncbi:hypothetical protein Hte_012553 [Hypoxylon texense]